MLQTYLERRVDNDREKCFSDKKHPRITGFEVCQKSNSRYAPSSGGLIPLNYTQPPPFQHPLIILRRIHVEDNGLISYFDHPHSSLKVVDRVDQVPEPAEVVAVKVHDEPRQIDNIGVLLLSRERPGGRNVALGQQDVLEFSFQRLNVFRTDRRSEPEYELSIG